MNVTIVWFMGCKGNGTRSFFFFGILGTLLSAQLVPLGVLAELVLQRTLWMETGQGVAERVG